MKTFLMAAAICVMATASTAATVVFDFRDNASNTNAASYSNGGIDLTVTATGGKVSRNNAGLGVSGAPEGARMGKGESLLFDFAPTLVGKVSGIVFERGPQTERFGLRVAGVETIFRIQGTPGSSSVSFDFASLFPSGGVTSFEVFGFGNGGGERGVQIRELTVAAVPLPAGGLLLLTGLGALALRRRKT